MQFHFGLAIAILCCAAAGAVETKDVVYGQGYVGTSLEATTFTPKDLTLDVLAPKGAGPFPAIVVVHGGSFQNGSKESKRVVELAEAIQDEGFACFLINYRKTGDFPPAPAPWNTTILQRAIHASFVDTKTALRFVRANAAAYNVDPARIAVLGESAGAFSALGVGMGDAVDYMNDGPELAPLEKNNLATPATVRAVVDLWGNAELIRDKFSPGDPPVMIVHGKADFHIGTFFAAAQNIKALCDANQIPCVLYGIEGAGHGCFEATVDGKPISALVAAFLKDAMKSP